DKGIWVLHQKGPYMEMDDLRIRPSDGNWHWENPGVTTQCFSQELPVFKRGVPRTLTGESHRDQIPTPTSLVHWMFVYKNPEGDLNCGAFFKGEQFVGAFRADVSPVFSPYSNPNSNTWDNQATPFSFEIVDETDGIVTVRYNSNQLDAAPARRYLGSDPTANDTLSGWISLAWGGQWPEGQALEGDVDWSELQRQIGNEGIWSTVYLGPATQWRDGSITYDTSGATPVLFRSRVRDTQGKYSMWSNISRTATVNPNGIDVQRGGVGNRYGLDPNYPNPFNPLTTIGFEIPNHERVRLRVFNSLGQEIATLVNEEMAAGRYRVSFSASELASGVYFYRLTAGGFTATRRMIVVK
ncbi:MAG TPA: T9SS type A sorting domain-containing protein, partial [Bacteroidota bacterium]|nr:T9SS type A sorting domain-containing protein [Bacteroidota bacterium]